MLLEFRTKNYKSFVDEVHFSMMPAPKQKGLDYSILQAKVGSKKHKGLCSAVIYGPNASGKTNLIGAMDTLKSIVLRGNIKNSDAFSTNIASSSLELIPNCNQAKTPTEFHIRFIDNGLLIDYFLEIDLGGFMDRNFLRKILEEQLSVNDRLIFRRSSSSVHTEIPSVIKPYINKNFKENKQTQKIAEGSLSETELFLTNGFKAIYAQELVRLVIKWFDEKFITVCHSEELRIFRHLANIKANTIYVEKTLTEAARAFGITANMLGYGATKDNEEEAILLSIVKDKTLPAEVFESFGTIRFITEFPLVIYALLHGCTLVVDEFDASIHPMALMSVINIFHNDEINKKNAQLIFNTHNPIFLDASLLRRDEIKFVERDEDAGNSVHYALSDFKTAAGIRKGEDYMHNYFVNRYGAIKDIDFLPIMEKIMNGAIPND